MDLAALGWSPHFDAAFAPYSVQGWAPGRVAVEDKHAYSVFTGQGARTAVVRGRLLHQCVDRSLLPKVGDWVALHSPSGGVQAVIEAVLPRRTRLARKVAGREMEEQVLAANVDVAFVVLALDATFNLRRLERFLVMVKEGGVRPVIVLNKADLGEQVGVRRSQAESAASGAPILLASARTGEGIKALRGCLRSGETTVMIGASGVGKSSLINRLYGEEIQPTLEVREGDAKGRHSTTWRELIPLPEGALVIDTPGMREFHMWTADEGLEEAFADLEALAAGCHFRNCTHTVESRCALLAAVARGELTRGRYESYLKLKAELAYLAEERLRHTFQGRREKSRSKHRRAPASPDRLDPP